MNFPDMCWHSPGMGCLEFWSQVPCVRDSHSFNRHLPPCVDLDARSKERGSVASVIQGLSPLPHSLPDGRVSETRSDPPLPFLAIKGSMLQGLKSGTPKAEYGPQRRSVWLTQMFLIFKKFFSSIEKLGYLSESSHSWLGPEPRLDSESSLDLNPAASLDGHVCSRSPRYAPLPPASLTLRLRVENDLFGLAYPPSHEASKNLQFLRRAYWQIETWREAEGLGDLAWVAFAWGFV